MIVRGAPAIGQVAAIGLALTRRASSATARPYARRATLRGARQRPHQRPADGGQPRAGRSTG